MDKSLSGLESMGLGKLSNINLFGNDEEPKAAAVKKPEPPKVNEPDFLFDKSFKCVVCDREFKAKVVKTGKARLLGQEIDLRPKYADIDALKYGVLACPICGYASMVKTYAAIGAKQSQMIKEQISSSFTGFGAERDSYTYDDALARHKLALINAVVKRAKTSERAYICLLIAWLLRGKRQTLPEDTQNYAAVIEQLKAEETDFLGKARAGFMDAFEKETFPLCGLDENTSVYLVAALCYETGMPEESLRWASRLITSGSANDRIKERARNLRDVIANEGK